MLIRDMEERDLNEVASLYELLMEEESNIENMIKQFSALKNNKSYILMVAEEEGKIAGTVMGVTCITMVSNFNSFLVIEDLIVDKNYRGKGIAKGMMLELEKRAKEADCSYAILLSGKQRKEAHKLYESLGYGEDGARGFRKFFG